MSTPKLGAFTSHTEIVPFDAEEPDWELDLCNLDTLDDVDAAKLEDAAIFQDCDWTKLSDSHDRAYRTFVNHPGNWIAEDEHGVRVSPMYTADPGNFARYNGGFEEFRGGKIYHMAVRECYFVSRYVRCIGCSNWFSGLC